MDKISRFLRACRSPTLFGRGLNRLYYSFNPTPDAVDIFEEGQFVDISGKSKGKGFQGVVKRHGFSGVGDKTHGQGDQLRAGGSVGGASDPSRVFKGTRMAGQTGDKKVTVQNLRILKIDVDNNLIVVKGCVPGHKNSYLKIQR
jgi:large subunit ribosomal protein L3